MNARSMLVEFERLVQLANPEYLINNKLDSETIFYFLNAAQERFIKLNYMSLDNLKQTVENLRKNTDTFKSLIVNKTLLAGTILEEGLSGQRFELPTTVDDMFFLYLRSHSYVSGTYMDIPDKVTKPGSNPAEMIDNAAVVPNVLITLDDVEKVLVSYYNLPILRQPCAVLESTTDNKTYIVIYTDSYTKLKKCNITYIRKPKKFNVIKPVSDTSIVDACELSTNVHQDIVELAVDMFITEGAYRLQAGGSKRNDNDKR